MKASFTANKYIHLVFNNNNSNNNNTDSNNKNNDNDNTTSDIPVETSLGLRQIVIACSVDEKQLNELEASGYKSNNEASRKSSTQ